MTIFSDFWPRKVVPFTTFLSNWSLIGGKRQTTCLVTPLRSTVKFKDVALPSSSVNSIFAGYVPWYFSLRSRSRQGALIVTEMGSELVNSFAGFGAEFSFSAPGTGLMGRSKTETMHRLKVILLAMNLWVETDIKISRLQSLPVKDRSHSYNWVVPMPFSSSKMGMLSITGYMTFKSSVISASFKACSTTSP